ncbi:cysteinyl-tRNA synthetase, partial [Linderina macrospora]
MVALPDETPNRRVRTTDPIKQVKYGMADSLGANERVSAWDLASSRFRMADDECLFGMFHARESDTSSSAISKYLCDHFLYAFREELDKVTEQASQQQQQQQQPLVGDDTAEARSADGKRTVNFAGVSETQPQATVDSDNRAPQLSNEQVQAAMRRTFLTLNKDLGTHSRQLIEAALKGEREAAAATAAENSPNVPAAAMEGSLAPNGPKIGDTPGGSTAAVAYIHGRRLHVANVGDALGVVSRRGNAVELSKRHDPADPGEMARIRAMGGYITQEGQVQGQIRVSRAFGYFHLLPYVNADPTIATLDLTEQDEFLILANRPVWDAITPQIAVDIARKHRRDPRMAAARVRDHVSAYGVTDSIMVMVICFSPMFAKQAARPARGFSVRDSVFPGVSDSQRTRHALSRRMSRSPSALLGS